MNRGRKLNSNDPVKTKRNVTLDADLFKQIREECIRMDYPFSYLTEDLLKGWMQTRKKEPTNAKKAN